MGKGVIVSSLGNAAYKVRVLKDVGRVDEAKQRCADGIETAVQAQTKAEQAEAEAKATITSLGEQLDAAIVAAKGSSSDPAVLALQKKQNEAADKLEAAQHDLAQAKLKKLAYEKQLAAYDDVSGAESRELWCADATESLAAGSEVGTIEINQESTQMLVAPGGEAADSILQPGMANDALATYYNWAILPGVQRHRPTYRVGTIKEIDYDADTCTVCLDDARSSAQNIRINPEGTPCEVQKDGPQGFVAFCEENPGHPACTANGSTKLPYSADLKKTLTEINKFINEANVYAYDSAQYGKLEHWTEMRQSGDSGDCEDFALAKYRACLNAGIPASALKIAVGKTDKGTGHAWLEVQTDQGNVALDLNTKDATFSDELPYSNRAVQEDGTNWSGKGLLLEDVPVEYMQCNAAAFAEDDRVVVHFKDSDWSKPLVVGFEEQPKRCGLYAIYKEGDYFRLAALSIRGESIGAKKIVGESDIFHGISGTAPFFSKDIKIRTLKLANGNSVETTTDGIVVASPFTLSEDNGYIRLNYYSEPLEHNDESTIFIYVVDTKTKKFRLLSQYNYPVGSFERVAKDLSSPEGGCLDISTDASTVFISRRMEFEDDKTGTRISVFNILINNNVMSSSKIKEIDIAEGLGEYIAGLYSYNVTLCPEGYATFAADDRSATPAITTKYFRLNMRTGETRISNTLETTLIPWAPEYKNGAWTTPPTKPIEAHHKFFLRFDQGKETLDSIYKSYSYSHTEIVNNIGHPTFDQRWGYILSFKVRSTGETIYSCPDEIDGGKYVWCSNSVIHSDVFEGFPRTPGQAKPFMLFHNGKTVWGGTAEDPMTHTMRASLPQGLVKVPGEIDILSSESNMKLFEEFGGFACISCFKIDGGKDMFQCIGQIKFTGSRPRVENVYIYKGGSDITRKVTEAIGCTTKDIMGFVYIPGL